MRCHAVNMVKRPHQPARIASTSAKPAIAEAEMPLAMASCEWSPSHVTRHLLDSTKHSEQCRAFRRAHGVLLNSP